MEYKINGLIDSHKAAEILCISKSKLDELRYKNEGPNFVKMGRSIRYRVADLDRYIDSMTERFE